MPSLMSINRVIVNRVILSMSFHLLEKKKNTKRRPRKMPNVIFWMGAKRIALAFMLLSVLSFSVFVDCSMDSYTDERRFNFALFIFFVRYLPVMFVQHHSQINLIDAVRYLLLNPCALENENENEKYRKYIFNIHLLIDFRSTKSETKRAQENVWMRKSVALKRKKEMNSFRNRDRKGVTRREHNESNPIDWRERNKRRNRKTTNTKTSYQNHIGKTRTNEWPENGFEN